MVAFVLLFIIINIFFLTITQDSSRIFRLYSRVVGIVKGAFQSYPGSVTIVSGSPCNRYDLKTRITETSYFAKLVLLYVGKNEEMRKIE